MSSVQVSTHCGPLAAGIPSGTHATNGQLPEGGESLVARAPLEDMNLDPCLVRSDFSAAAA